MNNLAGVRAWLWISAIASSAGWILSAAHALTRTGYVIFFVGAPIVAWVAAVALRPLLPKCANRHEVPSSGRVSRFGKQLNRFRRPFPLSWLIFTILILIGAIIYAPNNHTALSYRIPRSLQWIFNHGWFWIHSPDPRVNDRACGLEWLSTPLLLFTKTDRVLFLLNFIPWLLLPGLIFALWRHLGVRSRVAFYWMWLLPTGYVFLLQAGSTGNDTFPIVYLLAAMVFAVRAAESLRVTDVWYSIIAAALAIGAKPTCLPLMLPWALLLYPALRRLLRPNPIPSQHKSCVPNGTVLLLTTPICLVALLVSFLPNAILNIHYCGDWSGAKIENAGLAVKNPVDGIWGNAFLLTLKNFLPPFFPAAGWWNQHGPEVLPKFIVHILERSFEPASHVVGEVPTEEWAGVGFGISVLLLVSALFGLLMRQGLRRAPTLVPGPGTPFFSGGLIAAVHISFWLALIVFTTKSGMVDAARLATPYYPFICCTLLVGTAQDQLVRRRWWHGLAWLNTVMAMAVLVVVPSRPLFPARTILAKAAAARPHSRAAQRALNVYTVFAERSDPMANVRALLPSGAEQIGFLGTEDDIDISLWRPFFKRRLEYVLVGDTVEELRSRNLHYVVVGGYQLKLKNIGLEEWLSKVNGKVLRQTTAVQKLAEGSQPWYVVELK